MSENTFEVPNDVVDHYIKLATGEQIKVLLYILKNKEEFSIDKAVKELEIDKDNIYKSLDFWQKTSIFTSDTGIFSKIKTTGKKNQMSSEAVAELAGESNDVKFMTELAEKNLGRPLTVSENTGLIYIYKNLINDVSVIMTLLEYCKEKADKLNINFIIKKAEEWDKKGVKTLDQACEEISNEDNKKIMQNKIHTIFHLTAPFTSNQLKYVNSWIDKGYNLDIIKKAYENAIENINKANFKYIDTTLKNWSENGKNIKKNDKKSDIDNTDPYSVFLNRFGEDK